MAKNIKNKMKKILIATVVSSLSITALAQAPIAQALSEWESNQVYWGGDEVEHNGQTYVAKWWTQGESPSKNVLQAWDTPWTLKSSNNNNNNNNNNDGHVTPPSDSTIVYPDYSSVNVGQGIDWPETIFAPFVDAVGWPPFPLAEKTDELKIPFYNLGFIVSESKDVFKPTWGTYYAAEEGPLNDEIRKVREMGGDVIVSFGGAANVPLHAAAPDVESLKEQYKRFIKAYGLTRVDFDIEGIWLNDTTSLIRNSKALKLLQDELKTENYDLGIWFTLPVLPSGLTMDGVNVIDLALGEGVDIEGVNVMTMDYGDSAAPNPDNQMGEYGIQAIQNLQKQLKEQYSNHNISKTDAELWKMIGTTPMIGLNDVVTETFNQQDAKETLQFAKEKQIGMVSMWSMNRDKSPQGALSFVTPSASSIVQKKYEFSKIFNDYNDNSISNLDDNSNNNNDSNNNSNNNNNNGNESGNNNGNTDSKETWRSTLVYTQGDTVTHKGQVYESKWWTQGDAPDENVQYQWETPWKLVK
ncbi:carbohydrate-binding protein [Longirhabdus pacifica]|uniref:carbohydrate-binding protein n=1 Tax=Longirhabdus pacifica TaxID=2305227 RepID=UPI001008C39F|nr:carbohydrate-binding protein [Longirhabdus pacifica]